MTTLRMSFDGEKGDLKGRPYSRRLFSKTDAAMGLISGLSLF
jgi:hypothetical protein